MREEREGANHKVLNYIMCQFKLLHTIKKQGRNNCRWKSFNLHPPLHTHTHTYTHTHIPLYYWKLFLWASNQHNLWL